MADLDRDRVARVVSFNLDPEDELRVKRLGICEGRTIKVVQSGDPLIVRVAGADLGVARRLGGGIVIDPAGVEDSSDGEKSP